MSKNKNPDRKGWPAKKQVSSPNENYGTKERPSHPRGAEQMNEDFAKPGADQDIIREVDRTGHPDGDRGEPNR